MTANDNTARFTPISFSLVDGIWRSNDRKTWLIVDSRISFTFARAPDVSPFDSISCERASVSCCPDGSDVDTWHNEGGSFPRDAVLQICAARITRIIPDEATIAMIRAVLEIEKAR